MYSVYTVQGTGTNKTAVNNDALMGGGERLGGGLAEMRTYIYSAESITNYGTASVRKHYENLRIMRQAAEILWDTQQKRKDVIKNA